MAGHVHADLLAADVTAGAASHGGDLLTDLKAGYLLGARPRGQAVAQFFGVLVGAVIATAGYVYPIDPAELGGEKWPAPAAQVWAKVAELLSQGVDKKELHQLTAIEIAAATGALFALLEAVLRNHPANPIWAAPAGVAKSSPGGAPCPTWLPTRRRTQAGRTGPTAHPLTHHGPPPRPRRPSTVPQPAASPARSAASGAFLRRFAGFGRCDDLQVVSLAHPLAP